MYIGVAGINSNPKGDNFFLKMGEDISNIPHQNGVEEISKHLNSPRMSFSSL
jgi:hypothetical protein